MCPSNLATLTSSDATLVGIGFALALSILCDAASRHLRLPRVSILVLAGELTVVTVAGTIFFEILPPILTRNLLRLRRTR